MLAASLAVSAGAGAQEIVLQDFLLETSYAEASASVNNAVTEETVKQIGIATLEESIAAEFMKIHEWSAKYNGYLKTAEGFASTLKAGSQAYSECVRLFTSIIDISQAASENKEGILATFAMSDIYLETATELVTVFTLLKSTVAKGGEDNMLSGVERLEVLWQLDDHLTALNDKFRRLALSLRCYTIVDVWEQATAGIIERDVDDIARRAVDRWSRAARYSAN